MQFLQMNYSEFGWTTQHKGQGILGCCLLVSVFMLSTLWVPEGWAKAPNGINNAEVTRLAARAMKEFDVPGMAIGIVLLALLSLRSTWFGFRRNPRPWRKPARIVLALHGVALLFWLLLPGLTWLPVLIFMGVMNGIENRLLD